MGTSSVARDVVFQNLAKARLEAGTQVRTRCCCWARSRA